MICLILGLVTLPAEALLLPVARTPDPRVAAMEWAADLEPAALQSAAVQMENYPAVYRRAIMRQLDPRGRADAWRLHFRRYLVSHPELTKAQMSILYRAMNVVSDETFTPPVSADIKAQIAVVFNDAVAALGPKAASELFVTLGPKDPEGTNALPLFQQIADNVRAWRVVSAELPDCNCNIDIDTCDLVPGSLARSARSSTPATSISTGRCADRSGAWACTGWCKIIRWPWID